MMSLPSYSLYPTFKRPEFKGLWDGIVWSRAPELSVSHFRPESSNHHPLTKAKLLYSLEGLYGLFCVHDRYIRCVHRRFLDPVYKDSCVEFFVQPADVKGYFNFEFNCGGTLLSSYIEDPTRTSSGFKVYRRLTKQEGRQISIYHSLPSLVEPERKNPVIWYLEFFIPFTLLEKYIGHHLDVSPGVLWRANLFKCADETSHPHWASWSAIDVHDFHLPYCFGKIEFMAPSIIRRA